jgi:hypothetical protein
VHALRRSDALDRRSTTRSSKGWRALVRAVPRRLCKSPARLMVSSWVLAYLIVTFGPMRPVKGLQSATWAIAAGCVLLFVIGSLAGTSKRRTASYRSQPAPYISPAQTARLIRIFSILGVVGGACICIDKFFLSGIDLSAGFTNARFQGSSLGSLYYTSYSRSPLLYAGLGTYSFSIIAFLLYILNAETQGKLSLYYSTLSLGSPFAVAAVYGGRLGILLVPVLALAALAVRTILRIPRSRSLRAFVPILLGLVFVAAIYNDAILQERRQIFGVQTYRDELDLTERSRGYRAEPWVRALFENPRLQTSMLNIVSLNTYIINGVTNFDTLVNEEDKLGPYYTQYQIASIVSLLELTVPELSVADRMQSELSNADLLGVFVSNWGAFYLDFGWIGLGLLTLLWGFYSKRMWDRAFLLKNPSSQVAVCFLFVAIVFSPMHSLIGFASGSFLLLDCVIASVMIRMKTIRPHRAVDLGRPLPALATPSGLTR